MRHSRPAADSTGLEARRSAITKVDELRYTRTHLDGTGCAPHILEFVSQATGLPTREQLRVHTLAHALQAAAAENA